MPIYVTHVKLAIFTLQFFYTKSLNWTFHVHIDHLIPMQDSMQYSSWQCAQYHHHL